MNKTIKHLILVVVIGFGLLVTYGFLKSIGYHMSFFKVNMWYVYQDSPIENYEEYLVGNWKGLNSDKGKEITYFKDGTYLRKKIKGVWDIREGVIIHKENEDEYYNGILRLNEKYLWVENVTREIPGSKQEFNFYKEIIYRYQFKPYIYGYKKVN